MNQLKKRLVAAYSQKTTKLAVAGTMLMMSASSFAEDPAAAAFTAMGTKVTSYEGYAWPLVISLTGAVIGIKLFKKFANKAT